MMDTGANKNAVSLNMTTEYPVTSPVSDCTALLILFQILFPMDNFTNELGQELGQMDTWGLNKFTLDELPNPAHSKNPHEEDKDIKKTIDKRKSHESVTSVEEILPRIRRAVENNEAQVAELYTELQKRYGAIGNLRQELQECRSNNNANPEPRNDNVVAQLAEKEKEIMELHQEILNLSISSQMAIDRLSEENQIKDEENQKLKEELAVHKEYNVKNQGRMLDLNNENNRQAKQIHTIMANMEKLQEDQKNKLDLIAENAKKDETIRNLNQQVARLREVEQQLLQLNAESSRKEQEIMHLQGLAQQLQEVQRSAYTLNAENSRKGEELLHLRAQMQELLQVLEECKSETGIGRMMRKKHEFINRLFGG